MSFPHPSHEKDAFEAFLGHAYTLVSCTMVLQREDGAEASVRYRQPVRMTLGIGASAVVRERSAMIDILAFVFLVCGLLGMLKELHVDATVYGNDLAYDRLSSG